MQRYVIGIDIGTGSTKAVAIDPLGNIAVQAQHFYATHDTHPHFSEQDPESIWDAFVKTIQDVIAQLPVPPSAICFSSCMHSLLLVDENGKPLTPVITWADRRSAAIAEALRQTTEGEAIYKATGTPLHAMSPLCKIKWFNTHRPELFQNPIRFISIKEYIWFKLFGVYEIDYSIASATGLFDVQQLQWYEPALQWCGITAQQLSTPVPTHFIRSGLQDATAAVLNMPATTPFCIGASDGCLANVGSNALQPGVAAVTIGTSGAVRVASSTPIVLFPEMIFNYRLDAITFICGGAVNNGGNMVQWLLRQFLEITSPAAADYDRLFQRMATVPAGSDGLLCLPYLHGERTPLWDEQACGVFFGVRPQHRQTHFIRAALEGTCFALYDVLKKLAQAAGAVDTLHVSGGVVHSEPWLQMLADVTGKTVCVVQQEDASAVGAALLCYKAMGQIKGYDAWEQPVQKRLSPNAANHAVYNQPFSLFQELYTALKPTMHHLNN